VTKTLRLICTSGVPHTDEYGSVPCNSRRGMNRFDFKACAGSDAGLLDSEEERGTISLAVFVGSVPRSRFAQSSSNRKRADICNREAAPTDNPPRSGALAVIPDEFVFTGSKIEIARQIGNASAGPGARVADVVYFY